MGRLPASLEPHAAINVPSASSIPPASSPVLTVLASIVTSDPELGEPDEKTLITKFFENYGKLPFANLTR